MTIQIKEITENDMQDMLSNVGMLASILGFKTIDEITSYQYHACEGLMRFGGSFCKNLGNTLQSADFINAAKIIKHWRSECDEHAELHRLFIKKRNEKFSEAKG